MISTRVWSAQHPNDGRNIQQLITIFVINLISVYLKNLFQRYTLTIWMSGKGRFITFEVSKLNCKEAINCKKKYFFQCGNVWYGKDISLQFRELLRIKLHPELFDKVTLWTYLTLSTKKLWQVEWGGIFGIYVHVANPQH